MLKGALKYFLPYGLLIIIRKLQIGCGHNILDWRKNEKYKFFNQ